MTLSAIALGVAVGLAWLVAPLLLARFLALPAVTDWLIRRAERTPYSHIASAGGSEVYMFRFWLFNAYADEIGERKEGAKPRAWWRGLLPSIRLHHIMTPDRDRHLHDHPWNARTFVLRGWYREERYADESVRAAAKRQMREGFVWLSGKAHFFRLAGTTARLRFGQFHHITHVSHGGVWTLFVTWRYRGTWGFDVDGVKVPWREYLKERGQ